MFHLWFGDESGEQRFAVEDLYFGIYAAGGGKRNMANFARNASTGQYSAVNLCLHLPDVVCHSLEIWRHASSGEWIKKRLDDWDESKALRLKPEWFKTRFWDNKQEKNHPWFAFCLVSHEAQLLSSPFPVFQYYPQVTHPNLAKFHTETISPLLAQLDDMRRKLLAFVHPPLDVLSSDLSPGRAAHHYSDAHVGMGGAAAAAAGVDDDSGMYDDDGAESVGAMAAPLSIPFAATHGAHAHMQRRSPHGSPRRSAAMPIPIPGTYSGGFESLFANMPLSMPARGDAHPTQDMTPEFSHHAHHAHPSSFPLASHMMPQHPFSDRPRGSFSGVPYGTALPHGSVDTLFPDVDLSRGGTAIGMSDPLALAPTNGHSGPMHAMASAASTGAWGMDQRLASSVPEMPLMGALDPQCASWPGWQVEGAEHAAYQQQHPTLAAMTDAAWHPSSLPTADLRTDYAPPRRCASMRPAVTARSPHAMSPLARGGMLGARADTDQSMLSSPLGLEASPPDESESDHAFLGWEDTATGSPRRLVMDVACSHLDDSCSCQRCTICGDVLVGEECLTCPTLDAAALYLHSS